MSFSYNRFGLDEIHHSRKNEWNQLINITHPLHLPQAMAGSECNGILPSVDARFDEQCHSCAKHVEGRKPFAFVEILALRLDVWLV
jgi:hypothetical protein